MRRKIHAIVQDTNYIKVQGCDFEKNNVGLYTKFQIAKTDVVGRCHTSFPSDKPVMARKSEA